MIDATAMPDQADSRRAMEIGTDDIHLVYMVQFEAYHTAAGLPTLEVPVDLPCRAYSRPLSIQVRLNA